MKRPTGSLNWNPGKTGFRTLTAIIAIVTAIAIQASPADVPDRGLASLRGMYQVAASNDPLFPMDSQQEWFLDFGKGIHDGITSGKVAVSLRENPKVSVRIMVWQYFPGEKALLIGNQAAQGSGRAVARGVWTFRNDSESIVLFREGCSVILKRADTGDY